MPGSTPWSPTWTRPKITYLIFYIWLADNNGLKVVEALKRASARGVVCRAMADGLGSRAMIRSKYWKELRDAGVKIHE